MISEKKYISHQKPSELLTILMSVKNGEPYVAETVKSILEQTYKDFSFLILDNASTDNTRDIIRSFNDERIKLVELPEDIGQVAALKKGFNMCHSEFIGRIDADDISMPERFEKQLSFMKAHPEVGVCGTNVIAFNDQKEFLYYYPTDPDYIKVKLHFESCIPHPSAFIRKSFMEKYSLNYNDKLKHSYDWELWQRCSRFFPLVNIPEFLIRYRLHPGSESVRTEHLQKEVADYLDDTTLALLGLEKHPLRQINRDVAFETLNLKDRDSKFFDQVVCWFIELKNANLRYNLYSQQTLEKFLIERLFLVLNYGIRNRKKILEIFHKEKIYKYIGPVTSVKFYLKIFLSSLGIYRNYVK